MTRLLRHPIRLFLLAFVAIGLVLPVPLASQASGAPSPEDAWIGSTLAAMTLPEKVGQLFVVNAAGHSVDDPAPAAVQANQAAYGVANFTQLIEKYHLGGIIYFGGNVQSPAQVLGLSNGIQQVATSQPRPVPALISTDQEGGLVVRVGPPATVFPGNMALGATRDLSLGYQNALVMGEELRAVGVNTDLAPVVDVNTNPLNTADGARAFGDQTNLVSNFGAAQVLGFQNRGAGVAATAKHFPGLGSGGDTDSGPVVSNRTLAQLRQIDLPPFFAAKGSGTQQVMTSHLSLPNVDPSGIPASLSPTIVTGLLRNQVQFDGVVITDALQAGAIKSLGLSPAQVAVKAITAGNDQLLEQAPSSGAADLDAAYNGVIAAVQGGQITVARLDQSVTRILREKWRLGLVANPFAGPARLSSVVGTPPHLALAQQTAERSITLLKNRGNVLPLAAEPTKKVLVAGLTLGASLPSVDTLAAGITARGVPTTKFATGFHPTQSQIDQAVALAHQNDVVIASTYNVWGGDPDDQAKLVEALVATGKPVVVVAQNGPYDAAYLPGVAGFLAVYSYQAVTLNASVRVLFGEVNPTGKLPVTVTQPPPSTAVLYPFGFGLSYGR
ncbi:MAG TPA: glycoside hydrolase family 3 protein [Acidimicrobiales bacterium]|nr:glycoside hydrolase family 3 protein [Acidimicrobiales bacterium]